MSLGEEPFRKGFFVGALGTLFRTHQRFMIHLENLARRQPALAPLLPKVQDAFELLTGALTHGQKILLCGNGGSASDCEHWAGELLKGFVHRRPLSQADRAGLPAALGERLQWGFPAIPLTGFPALSTAFANDVEPDFIFAQLIWVLGQPGDVLVALSTSGNSPNVCHAAEAARARGMKILGLTGRAGGKLKALSDICLAVPADETYLIQELHLPIYHTLCLMIEDARSR